MLEDGKRSITRYFINNFYDTDNQNGLDFVLGKVQVDALVGVPKHNPTSTILKAAGMLIAPYYFSSLLLHLSGKQFNWQYFAFLIGLSGYMAYSYLLISSRKLWSQQILKE